MNNSEYQKQWREDNREKCNAYQRQYTAQHQEWVMLRSARFRAKRSNLPFNLEISDIIIPDCCPVLGIRLMKHTDGKKGYSPRPSLDRIIPEKGYVKGNVRVISGRANLLKNNATIEEIELVIKDLEDIACNHKDSMI